MPNYKENNISGKKWQRAVRVVIENPYQALPSILFVEEEVVEAEDKLFKQPCANLSTSFDMNNPLHVEIYTKLNELYTLLREARDAG